MGPKLDPHRIFDARALRKPLGGLLERSWSLLEPKKQTWNRSWPLLEASWSDLRAAKGGYAGSRSTYDGMPGGRCGPGLSSFELTQA